MEAGAFALVRRGLVWGEILLVAVVSPGEWIAYTTTSDASRFMWTVVRFSIGTVRLVTGRSADRQAPAGLRAQEEIDQLDHEPGRHVLGAEMVRRRRRCWP